MINTAASTLVTALGTDGANLQGVLDEVVACLPVVLPVAISFIAIRKGIDFVMGMLRGC